MTGGAIRTDNQLISSTVTGTAPLSVASTTAVANLHADNTDAINTTTGPTRLPIGAIADGQCLLRSSGSIIGQTCSPVTALGNPSASTGFTVVNGSGTTAMFANAAPALAAIPAGMIRDMAHAQLGGL